MNSEGTPLRRITSLIFADTLNPTEHFTEHSEQSSQTWFGVPARAQGPGKGEVQVVVGVHVGPHQVGNLEDVPALFQALTAPLAVKIFQGCLLLQHLFSSP